MSWQDILKAEATEEQRIEDAKNYAEPADLAGPNKTVEKLLDYIIDDITNDMMNQSIDSYYPGSKISPIFPYEFNMRDNTTQTWDGKDIDMPSLMGMRTPKLEAEINTLLRQHPKYKNWANRDFPHNFSKLIIKVTFDDYNLSDGYGVYNFIIDKDNVEYKDRR